MFRNLVFFSTVIALGLTNIVGAEEKKPLVKPYSIEANPNIETESTESTESLDETETELQWVEVEEFDTVLFLGDSRVVGMSSASGRYSYIGKNGAGYDWLVSTGEPELRKMLAEYPNMDVVLSLGVNDLGNIDSYIEKYRAIKQEFPDTRIWVMSVMPVLESVEQHTGYSVQNSTVDDFNNKLKEEFNDRYIDTYSYLIANGFKTWDGVHYTEDTYVDLENYVVYYIMSNLNQW